MGLETKRARTTASQSALVRDVMVSLKYMTHAIRSVLFDLDGTMVDNMQYHVDAWIEMGKKLGHELTREYIQREFSGRKNEELFPALMGRALDAAELQQLSEEKE